MLTTIGIQDCRSRDTAISKGDKFSLNQCPKTNLKIQEMQKIPYASIVGSLMYAKVCTLPNIAYIVGVLGRYLSNPGMDHWKASKKFMRYLKRTRDYMLTYKRSNHLEIIGYSNSDFARCEDSSRSTSGYVYLLAGGAICWRSVKQGIIATSTIEAEFIACFEASNHGIWLRNFVTRLGIINKVEKTIKLFRDNKSAMLYSNNNKSSTKSKNFKVKYRAVKKRVQNKEISIENIGVNSMLVDPLSKGLTTEVFYELIAHLRVLEIEESRV